MGVLLQLEKWRFSRSATVTTEGFMMKPAGTADVGVVRGAQVVSDLVRRQRHQRVDRRGVVLRQSGAGRRVADGADPGDADGGAGQIAAGEEMGEVGAVEQTGRPAVVALEGAELVQRR